MKRKSKFTYTDRHTAVDKFKYTKSGDEYAVTRNGGHRLLKKGNEK